MCLMRLARASFLCRLDTSKYLIHAFVSFNGTKSSLLLASNPYVVPSYSPAPHFLDKSVIRAIDLTDRLHRDFLVSGSAQSHTKSLYFTSTRCCRKLLVPVPSRNKNKPARKPRKVAKGNATRTMVVYKAPPAQAVREKPARVQRTREVVEEKAPAPKQSIGQNIGGRIGSFLGGMAERLFTSIAGQGDYTEVAGLPYEIQHNTLTGTPVSHQIPRMANMGNAVRVSHREFISDIVMTDLFNNAYMRFAPTNQTMFPWLYSIAESFEQYKFLGIVFEFRSLAANAVTATVAGMGSLTLSTQYNVYEPVHFSKVQANNAQFATSCKPSESMFHPVECDPLETPNLPLYIQHPLDIPGDQRFNEMGTLNIVTQGAPAAYGGAGELWVTYDILLFKPIVPQNYQPGFSPPPRKREPGIGVVYTQPDGTLTRKTFESFAELNRFLAPPRPRSEIHRTELDYVRI